MTDGGRLGQPTLGLIAIALLVASHAYAQSSDKPTVSSSLDADVLADLPGSDNLFSMLETTEPSVTSDRFSAGGLYTGEAARLGSFFSSWTQTFFRLGDVSLSDPTGSGAPLLIPDLTVWRQVDILTGLMPVDLNAPGLAVTLELRRPPARWERTISSSGSPAAPGLAAGPPPITRLNRSGRVSARAAGPMVMDGQGTTRLAGVFAASTSRGSQFYRSEASAEDSTITSGLAELLWTPSERSDFETVGWVQHTSYPYEMRTPFSQPGATTSNQAAHLQAVWERHHSTERRWRVFGSYTERRRTPKYSVLPGPVFERLTDGSVSDLAFQSKSVVSQWSAGVRSLPAAATPQRLNSIQAGIEFSGARQRASSFFSGLAGESIDGIPARVWRFVAPTIDSIRHETNLTAYLTDHLAIGSRVTLDAGVRLDSTVGAADGAAGSLHWRSALPRVDLEWILAKRRRARVFVGVGRSAYRLPLDLLAVGDPAAPTADIFQWAAPAGGGPPAATSMGSLVARAGPGTGGNPSFSSIAPNIKRPFTDEFVIGLESQFGSALRLCVLGFDRRESDLLGLVNVGAPASAYSIVRVPDPGVDLFGPADDQLLPFYSRLPPTFGQDRYVLMNPREDAATSKSFEISGELRTKRLILFGGATASKAEGPAANRGFGPLENDQSVLGELFANPNAETYARGRLFTDRAYTIKVSAIGRFPGNVHLGIVARYQDGQPFARLAILSILNQGAEAVRAFPNGASRFTFTETVDVRLQKGFGAAGDRVAVIIEAFNVLNTANEVEERVVTGPSYRTVTAIQPPRIVRVGFRLGL